MANNNFALENFTEFDGHKSLIFINDRSSGLRGYIAIHRGGVINPAFGATRVWEYASEEDAVREALRLAKCMSYKLAMAGLNYGGAKAVILNSPKCPQKEEILNQYIQRVNCLGGHFITGMDVGITEKELELMASGSEYIVGMKGDAVKFTALGVYYAMQVVLKKLFGSETTAGRSFAIQGLGKTGTGILSLIYEDAGEIYAADIDKERVDFVKRRFPKVKIVNFDQIDKQEVDIFAPCALSNAVNSQNINSLKCKAVVGSANNQLESPEVGDLLHKKGILYAPDYIVNAGGVITVVEEYECGSCDEDSILTKVKRIKETLGRVMEISRKEKRAISTIADELAVKISDKFI